MLLIAWGVGFGLCVLAILLMPLFHKKNGSKLALVMLFVLGFVTFTGSGFLHWDGMKSDNGQDKEPPKTVQQEIDVKNEKDDVEPSKPDVGAEDVGGGDLSDDNPPVNPDPEPVNEPTPEPVIDSNSSGTLGDYFVEIKDAVISTTREGERAIVITYSWTNNSEETTSAEVAFMERAFQYGIQLDSVYDSSMYDTDLSFKNLRPGASLDVQSAFLVTDENAVIEFELSELISFSNDAVTKNFDPTKLG